MVILDYVVIWFWKFCVVCFRWKILFVWLFCLVGLCFGEGCEVMIFWVVVSVLIGNWFLNCKLIGWVKLYDCDYWLLDG